jgi:hypothetical protein
MDAGTIANIGLAALALVISGIIAIRQLFTARRANYLSISLHLLTETTSADFLSSEEYIVNHLNQEHGSENGISRLPEPARSQVWRVAYMYQTVGYLAALHVLDRKMTRYLVGLRVVNTWRSLSDFVAVERQVNSNGIGFRFYEDLASRCRDITAAKTSRRFRLRRFVDTVGLTENNAGQMSTPFMNQDHGKG